MIVQKYRYQHFQGTPGFPQTRSRTGTEPGPDRTRNTAHDDMHFSDILIPFGQVSAAKDWKSIQIWLIQIMSSLLFFLSGGWFWFLLDRFWLPKTDKVIKSGWFQSFQFYRSDLLVWWLWFHLDKFWLRKIEKVFKSGWFTSFQF